MQRKKDCFQTVFLIFAIFNCLLVCFECVQCAAESGFLSRNRVLFVDAVFESAVNDGYGFGKELFCKSNVACFDCCVVFLDCGFNARFLCVVDFVSLIGSDNSLFC